MFDRRRQSVRPVNRALASPDLRRFCGGNTQYTKPANFRVETRSVRMSTSCSAARQVRQSMHHAAADQGLREAISGRVKAS